MYQGVQLTRCSYNLTHGEVEISLHGGTEMCSVAVIVLGMESMVQGDVGR